MKDSPDTPMTTPLGGATWQRASTGEISGIRWRELLDSRIPVDPYMVWADLTGAAGFSGVGPSDTWPVLVEFLTKPELPTSIASGNCADQSLAIALLEVPGLYKSYNSQNNKVALSYDRVSARISPCALRQLITDPTVSRVQLGMPRIPKLATPAPNYSFFDPQASEMPRTVIGVIDDGCPFAHPDLMDDATTGRSGDPRVRYLWDQDPSRSADGAWNRPSLAGYGAELKHEAIRSACKVADRADDERLAYIEVGYAPVDRCVDLPGLQPDDAAQVNGVAPLRHSTHGTGVLMLAAGNRPPVLEQFRPTGDRAPALDDNAANWPIVFVQLPTRTVWDTSGGSLGVHVLDGIHYIIDRARRIKYLSSSLAFEKHGENTKLPEYAETALNLELAANYIKNEIIINVSFGSIGGSHDGTSILELAMAEIVDAEPKVSIVLSAGNAHRSNTHARATLTRGASCDFHWAIGPDNPHETFLEIWLPAIDADAQPMLDADLRNVVITVSPPGGDRPCEVRLGQAMWLRTQKSSGHSDDSSPPRRFSAGAIYARKVVQGLHGTMVLLAVAPTRAATVGEPERPHAQGQHGDWQVNVAWGASTDGPQRRCIVHAWTERNDLLYGHRRGQQSSVASTEAIPPISDAMPEARFAQARQSDRWPWPDTPDPFAPTPTLSSVAGIAVQRTAPIEKSCLESPGSLVVVGGYKLSDGEIAAYSGSGPSRHSASVIGPPRSVREPLPVRHAQVRDGPDVVAPSDAGESLRGLRVNSWIGGGTARISGTSAAAPTVTRYIANQRYAPPKDQAIAPGVDNGAVSEPRKTLTPTMDDRYRNAPRQIGPAPEDN